MRAPMRPGACHVSTTQHLSPSLQQSWLKLTQSLKYQFLQWPTCVFAHHPVPIPFFLLLEARGYCNKLSSLICFCIITFLSWAVSIISHQEIILTFQQLHNNSLQTWLKLLSHTLKLSSYLLHFLFIINLLLRGYQRLCLETIIFQRLLKIQVDKIYFRDKRYKKRFIFIWHFGCPPQVYFCTNWF